jgi:6-phosphofructokinase 1
MDRLSRGTRRRRQAILIPEVEFDLDRVCDYIVRRFESQYSPIVVVAEGAQPKGGVPEAQAAARTSSATCAWAGSHWLEGEIEERTGNEARATVLGHVQRGGTPTAFDRVLATRFGLHAIDATHDGQWGKMTALRSTNIELVDLKEATAELKTVPDSLYREAEVFFG